MSEWLALAPLLGTILVMSWLTVKNIRSMSVILRILLTTTIILTVASVEPLGDQPPTFDADHVRDRPPVFPDAMLKAMSFMNIDFGDIWHLSASDFLNSDAPKRGSPVVVS